MMHNSHNQFQSPNICWYPWSCVWESHLCFCFALVGMFHTMWLLVFLYVSTGMEWFFFKYISFQQTIISIYFFCLACGGSINQTQETRFSTPGWCCSQFFKWLICIVYFTSYCIFESGVKMSYIVLFCSLTKGSPVSDTLNMTSPASGRSSNSSIGNFQWKLLLI